MGMIGRSGSLDPYGSREDRIVFRTVFDGVGVRFEKHTTVGQPIGESFKSNRQAKSATIFASTDLASIMKHLAFHSISHSRSFYFHLTLMNQSHLPCL